MKWYFDVMKKYAVFSGRARRKEYWMFVLFNFIIMFVTAFVLGFIGGILGAGTVLADFVTNIYVLAVLVPSIAVGVRRMHDTGRSGWWILLPIVNLVFLCSDSQPGKNEYGPNPKANSVVDEKEVKTIGSSMQSGDFEQQLRKLSKLQEEGIISAEDFEKKKGELLGLA